MVSNLRLGITPSVTDSCSSTFGSIFSHFLFVFLAYFALSCDIPLSSAHLLGGEGTLAL